MRPLTRHAVGFVSDDARRTAEDAEVVDGLPGPGGPPPVLEPGAAGAVPARQAAALAATGFVAGAATVAVVHRRREPRRAPAQAQEGQGRARRDRRLATRSWSTSTCSAGTRHGPGAVRAAAVEVASRRGRSGCGGGSPTGCCAGAARRCSGCCTSAASACTSAWSSRRRTACCSRARAHARRPRAEGIARMRFATGVDDDLRPFHERFRDDPVIGRGRAREPAAAGPAQAAAVGGAAWRDHRAADRVRARGGDPAPADRRLGRRCPETGLRDGPPPAAVAGAAPARLASFDLAPKRAIALRRAAAEVAAGRADLGGDRAPTRLPSRRGGCARSPDIGPWTRRDARAPRARPPRRGPGRRPRLPQDRRAAARPGNPKARAEVAEVREFFAPYGDWKGLAGEYLRYAWASRARCQFRPDTPGSSPSPGRNSLVSARAATGGRLSSPFACIQRP